MPETQLNLLHNLLALSLEIVEQLACGQEMDRERIDKMTTDLGVVSRDLKAAVKAAKKP